MIADLIFVRHGQTEWNVAGRLQGHGDSPLTALGRRQVAAHLPWLRTLQPRGILASPLGRTRATAAILAADLGLDVAFDEDLRERAMGRFEGRTLPEIETADPASHHLRVTDPWHWRPPGGENYDDLLVRTAPLVERLRTAAGPLVVVSHGTLVRPLLAGLLALDAATTLRILAPNDLAYRVVLPPAGAPRVSRRHGGIVSDGLLLRDE